MSSKLDATTGVISIAIFGLQATLSPADAKAWGDTILQVAPAILILFLIWRIWRLDKQHSECNKNWMKTQDQLALAYRALLDEDVKHRLPEEHDFISGNFDIEQVTQERRHARR